MTELLYLLNLYSTLGVTYLLLRRFRTYFHYKKYKKWLQSEKQRIEREIESGGDVGDVVREFQRTYPQRETSEEREWRVEQRWLSKNRIGEGSGY